MIGAMADTVGLRLPAGTAYGRVARVTTAAIARRHEFTYREVEDLRLAIDEAIIALLDDQDPDAAVDLTYTVEGTEIAITVDGAEGRPPEAVARFHTIVTGLVDQADIDLAAGTVHLVKRRA
jgi:hypothetical protein